MTQPRPDYPKIIAIGIVLALFSLLFLFVGVLFATRSVTAAAVTSLLGTVLFMITYGVVSVRHAAKLGAALPDPGQFKNDAGLFQCSSCGATTSFENIFREDPRSFGRHSGLLCPSCFLKRHASVQKGMAMIYGAIAVLGVLFVLTDRRSAVGGMLLNLALFYLFCFLATIPHELAHAAAACAGRLRVFRVSLGMGKLLLTMKRFGWTWEIRAIPVSGAVLFGDPSARYFRLKRFLVTLAGPAANGLILLVLLWMVPVSSAFAGFPNRVAVWADMFVANALLLLGGLWPHRSVTIYGEQPSDGLALLTIPFMKQPKIQEALESSYAQQAAEHMENGDLVSAGMVCAEGLKRFPESLRIRNNAAVVYGRRGEHEEARRVYERLLQDQSITPQLKSLFQNNLAFTYLSLGDEGDLPKADQLSAEACASASWIPAFKGTRGSVLVEMGRLDEGLELLRNAMQSSTDGASKALIACHIAIGEARKGNRREALCSLDAARILDPSCFLLPRAARETGEKV